MHLSLDKEGFLIDLATWSKAVAEELAARERVELTDSHWQIIETVRDFHASTEVSPAMRAFVKLVRQQLGDELGNSIALMQLFGESPAKTAAKISGLPRPTNCL